MGYYIRLQIVDFADQASLYQYRSDLFQFCKMLRIPQPKEAAVPGHTCFDLYFDKKKEKTVCLWLKAFEALECLNPHFVYDLRETE